MGPEFIAGTSAVLAALVTAGPAYLAARRSGRTAVDEGTATREALAALAERVEAANEAHERDRREVREILACLHREVRGLREWQVAHDAEHALWRGK